MNEDVDRTLQVLLRNKCPGLVHVFPISLMGGEAEEERRGERLMTV